MQHSEELIERAVMAMLACPRAEDAAKECGVSRTTLWRMAQEPDFKRRLREARAQLSEQIVVGLHANALDAMNTLREIMLDKQAPASARVAASAKLVELSFSAQKQLDTDKRLAAVEAALRLKTGGAKRK